MIRFFAETKRTHATLLSVRLTIHTECSRDQSHDEEVIGYLLNEIPVHLSCVKIEVVRLDLTK